MACPQIRRFHNGSWGAVFGNGSGSMNGDAGIYVMLVDPRPHGGGITFYYLSTSTGSADDSPTEFTTSRPRISTAITSLITCMPGTCSGISGASI